MRNASYQIRASSISTDGIQGQNGSAATASSSKMAMQQLIVNRQPNCSTSFEPSSDHPRHSYTPSFAIASLVFASYTIMTLHQLVVQGRLRYEGIVTEARIVTGSHTHPDSGQPIGLYTVYAYTAYMLIRSLQYFFNFYRPTRFSLRPILTVLKVTQEVNVSWPTMDRWYFQPRHPSRRPYPPYSYTLNVTVIASCLIYSQPLLEYVILFCCSQFGCVLIARCYLP